MSGKHLHRYKQSTSLQTDPLTGVLAALRQPLALIIACGLANFTAGQPPEVPPQNFLRSSIATEPWPKETVPSPNLPERPEAIGRLHQAGNVRFVFYDPARYPREYAGETRFNIDYQTKSQFRWRLVRQATGQRELVIRTDFDELDFELKHQILLPITMADEQFYTKQLVRHEFDHVRISTDPRFQKLLSKWLKSELKVVRVEVGANHSKDELNEFANTAVQQQADQLFKRMLALIQVRYSELDRTTRHGAEPLPEDFFAEESQPQGRK